MGCTPCSAVWFSAGIAVATKTGARALCLCDLVFLPFDKVGEGHLTRDSRIVYFMKRHEIMHSKSDVCRS